MGVRRWRKITKDRDAWRPWSYTDRRASGETGEISTCVLVRLCFRIWHLKDISVLILHTYKVTNVEDSALESVELTLKYADRTQHWHGRILWTGHAVGLATPKVAQTNADVSVIVFRRLNVRTSSYPIT